jgi:hypothetical protein
VLILKKKALCKSIMETTKILDKNNNLCNIRNISLQDNNRHMKFSFNSIALSILAIVGLALSPAFIGSAAADATSTNLVVNGSFETPVVTDPSGWDIFPSGTPGLGWDVFWGPNDATTYNGQTRPEPANLELQQNGHLGYQAADGNQWAELDTDWFGPNTPSMSYPSSVNIYQNIPTIPGDQYALSFEFSPRPDAPNANENIIRASWNDDTVADISRANISGTHNEWETYNYTLLASSTVSKIGFCDLGIPDGVGTYLDNVIITDLGASTTATSTNPGGGGGTGTTTATSTDPGNGGGGTGTTTATTTPTGGSGGGGSSSNGGSSGGAVTASGYGGNFGGPSSGGGQVLGASTGPSTTASTGSGALPPYDPGEVLGASTSSLPNMPYTGTNGNAVIASILGYVGALIVSEALIKYFRAQKTQK